MEGRNPSKNFVMRWGTRRMTVKELKHQRRMHHHQLLLWHERWFVFESILTLVQQSCWASQPKQLQSKPLHPKTSSKHNNYNNNNNKPQIKYQSIQVCHTVGATNTHWHTNKHTHPFFRPQGKSLTRKGKSLCKNQLLEFPKKEQERKKERKNPKSLSFSFLCAQRKVIKGLFF